MTEPRKFLGKLNPDATPRSVLRRAGLTSAAGACLWGLAFMLRPNPEFQPTLWTLVLFVFTGFVVGVVWEWQVPREWSE